MAKKLSKSAPSKKTAASKKRTTGKPASVPKVFRERWLELTGRKLAPSARLPAALISSITTLRVGQAAAVALANPDIQVFARKVQGKECGKVAEIAGWYEMNLAPNLPCIGQAAVKAALDAVATAVCCQTLQCPEKCPCHYIPQPQLALYTCVPGVMESGYLLQGLEVWNCECLKPPTG